MTHLFKKLNYKNQEEICILNAPEEFEQEIQEMQAFTKIQTDLKKVQALDFVLSFVKTQEEINTLAPLIDQKLVEDGIVWFAFPKKSSKKYKVAINRDQGWDMLGVLGMETVRSVAIDDDWSTLRFRKVEYVKTLKRNEKLALSTAGKMRTKQDTKK